MGRPPCCDKDGIKKGPWTPEEDIILVSYIQQHGPGNWRSVPTTTGLQRCSKSCRLRWTNYLRPGIKRGNFTPHEEGMIIHLQAILGNKWAAIASYLPQRTDNDIKNYWNTHLKKKLKRFQSNLQQDPQAATTNKSDTDRDHHHHLINNNNDDHGHNMVTPPQPSSSSSSSTTTCYASSTENISRLLESWMKCPTSTKANVLSSNNNFDDMSNNNNNNNKYNDVGFDNHVCEEDNHHFNQYDTMLSFDNNLSNHKIIGNVTMASTAIACDDSTEEYVTNEGKNVHDENMENLDDDENNNPPLTFLEKWLLDESTTSRQVADEILRLPSIF